jgi:hypothetical protein
MYMLGRFRTASSPSNTVIDEAPYSACPEVVEASAADFEIPFKELVS